MKIKKFWANGYRSLHELTLGDLGPFNIFYGHNGSGKSNILAAIEVLLGCIRVINTNHPWQLNSLDRFRPEGQWGVAAAGAQVFKDGVLSPGDFSVHAPHRELSLGGIFEGDPGDHAALGLPFREILVEVEVSEVVPEQRRMLLKRLSLDGQETLDLYGKLPRGVVSMQALLARLTEDFSFVHADRVPRKEKGEDASSAQDTVRNLLRAGNLKRALFVASTSVNPGVRRRFRELRALVTGPPLNRPSFDVVHDPTSGAYDIREPLGNADVSIDQIGLGLAQAYSILAGVLLGDADIAAIEEPEAHLHAPTLGREVRSLLERVVKGGTIQQLFIATHSNLFDLDPSGYWNVSMKDGKTLVERRPLDDIDRLHLFEPGPAKHQLQVLLEQYGEEIVFRSNQGKTLDATQMLIALQRGDEDALSFLESMHGAALQVTGLRARRAASLKKGGEG